MSSFPRRNAPRRAGNRKKGKKKKKGILRTSRRSARRAAAVTRPAFGLTNRTDAKEGSHDVVSGPRAFPYFFAVSRACVLENNSRSARGGERGFFAESRANVFIFRAAAPGPSRHPSRRTSSRAIRTRTSRDARRAPDRARARGCRNAETHPLRRLCWNKILHQPKSRSELG